MKPHFLPRFRAAALSLVGCGLLSFSSTAQENTAPKSEPSPNSAKGKSGKQSEDKTEENPVPDYSQILFAMQTGNIEKVLELTKSAEDQEMKHIRASVLQQRGVQRFFNADIKGSVADFDEVVALEPKRDPYHWQRGISYYYAGKYREGKEQFERHQSVNSQDVENAVWHYLCSVRAEGGSVESARKNLIPISDDPRVPMKEVHDLFAGKGSEEAIMKAAARTGNPKKSERAKNAHLYAHLYLAVYYEAIGQNELMKQHIARAAGEFRMDHYMGMVAQVHAKLRGVKIPKTR